MASRKKQRLFMIVAGRRKQKGLGSRYLTTEGALTALRSRAAKFQSPAEAEAFAAHRDKPLGDRLYIGKRDEY